MLFYPVVPCRKRLSVKQFGLPRDTVYRQSESALSLLVKGGVAGTPTLGLECLQKKADIYTACIAIAAEEGKRSFGIIGFLVIDRITSAPVTSNPPAMPNAQL